MKKLFSLLLGLLSLAAQAQTMRYLGYTVTDDIDVKDACFGEAGTYSIGALMTADMLEPYVGCRITGLRVASSLDLGRTRNFIYRLTDSRMEPVVEQKQRLYEGWNQVTLNGDGYTITEGEALFFGFDYVETEEMVAKQEGGLCGVDADTDGAFYWYGTVNGQLNLYSISGIGKLCVQLVVDVSSLPQYDLDMTYLDTGFKYKSPGEDIEAFAVFANTGREALNNYQVGYQFDNAAPVFASFEKVLSVGQDDSWQFTCQVPDDCPVGMHTLKVFVGKAEGQPLARPSRKDTLTASFAVYRQSLLRKQTYMEVYSDQSSPYTPFFNDALRLVEKNLGDILCVVNVHKPQTPLAVAEAEYLHWLYAYTWPTFTVNRSYFPGEAYVSYDLNDYLPVVGTDFSAGLIASLISQDHLTPSFAGIELNASFDRDSRRLDVTASGELLPESRAIFGNLALTLILTEDDVASRQLVYNAATGRSSYKNDYRHSHVLRGYMTNPVGDALPTTSDEDYTATYSTTIPQSWDVSKMQVVALLTKHVDQVTDDNVKEVDVVNAQSFDLATIVGNDGIAELEQDAPKQFAGQPVCYGVDGKRARVLRGHKGFRLERYADGSVRKVFVRK